MISVSSETVMFVKSVNSDTCEVVIHVLLAMMYYVLYMCIRTESVIHIGRTKGTAGCNYDSLFARTVAYPVQVAYWTKEVIAPCGYSVPCQF